MQPIKSSPKQTKYLTDKPTPMNKQPQTCYVHCDNCDNGIYIDIIAGCCNNPNENGSCCGNLIPVQVQEQCPKCRATGYIEIQNIYIHTPEELALAFRERAEKVWDAAILSSLPIGEPLDTDEAYRNYVRKQQYLDQHYPLPQPLNTKQ